MKKSLFVPDVIFDKVWDITPEFLKKNNISGLIVDIDNTLALAEAPVPYAGVTEWLNTIKKSCIDIIFMSNNMSKRVEPFAKKMGYEYIHMALKPFPINFSRAKKMLGKDKSQIAMVGDQIFTDIAGGNLNGIMTILVKPFEPKTEGGFFFRIKRKMEKKYIDQYNLLNK